MIENRQGLLPDVTGGSVIAGGFVGVAEAGESADFTVSVAGVLRRYSNRSDLLEQLRKVAVILPRDGHDGNTRAEVAREDMVRSWRLRDRFSSEDLQSMIDLYRSGATARQVAENYCVSLRSVKRLLHQHGIRRERAI